MTAFEEHFSKDFDVMLVTDVGEWTMEIKNDDGEIFQFEGSLCSDIIEGPISLSEQVRDELENAKSLCL